MNNNCFCGQPPTHKRVGLCDLCYKIKRKEDWNKNHAKRILNFDYLSDRRAKNLIAATSWQKLNKKRIYERQVERSKLDINFRLSRSLRKRFSEAIKNNAKCSSVIKDLGCSIDECRQHLEFQFQPNMTWDNYGKWHIDHIVPLASFDLANPEELKKACHYTNLQPLWAKDNLSKGDKYE